LTGLSLLSRGARSHGAPFMMTPRPIYKWKSFTLGVVVLVFLGWAWVRSVQHRDAVTVYFPSAQHSVTLASRAGSCTVAWEELPSTGVTWPVFTTQSSARNTGIWFQEAVEIGDMGGGRYWAEMAYWFIILLVLVAWSLLLILRWRRVRSSQRS
jgi:hypothetical protein